MSTKTQFKTDIVERYKKGESSYQISEEEGCSYNTILRELRRRGINTGLRFWTKKEIKKLKEFYPISSKEELLREFSDKKEGAIGGMAKKLGLRKKECKKNCNGCKREFTIKLRREYGYKKGLCLKCLKKRWEYNNSENGRRRKTQWLQRNPEYIKNYVKIPEIRERINRYFRQLREENPQFRLDHSMSVAIHHSLRGKKAGRKWESLIDYTLKDLVEHLESRFDKNMTWENYGIYWHIDHVRPISLFKYISSEDQEFKKCWALENLQPLEKIANLRKSNIFIS